LAKADPPGPSPLKRAFPPVVDTGVRVLILGSLPGEASLAAAQYYAHPRNAFWRLVGGVLDENLAALPYQTRLGRLLARHVGLWDVIETARRRGSLDAAIKNAETRDLAALTATLPNLRAVAFNGGKSAAIGQAALAGGGLALVRLPSSSPAYAGMTFERKQSAWSELRRYL
jgi:hypoxanthine-DNA glycosylase